MFRTDEYNDRLARLVAELDPCGIDLAVISHQPDLFYYSGTCQASYLLVTRKAEVMILARRGAVRASAETTLPVVEFNDPSQLWGIVRRSMTVNPCGLGLAFDVTRHDQVLRLHRAFPQAELIDLSPIVRGLRQIKSLAELELIRLAARQVDGACRTAASLLRLDQSELELAIRIEAYLRRKGHPGLVRVRQGGMAPAMGYVAAGASTVPAPELDTICVGPGLSPAMPFGAGDHEFRAGEPVLFDYYGCCGGYMAEEGRMLSLNRPPAEAGWAHEAMRQVLRKIETLLGPGQATGRLYEAARREARFLGYEEQFLSSGRGQLPFVGHGIGLELDEPPFLAVGRKDKLAPGMVLAIGPRVLLPGLGVVGVENTYLVTEGGFETLTTALEDWRQVPID